jgi:hypothetical protein
MGDKTDVVRLYEMSTKASSLGFGLPLDFAVVTTWGIGGNTVTGRGTANNIREATTEAAHRVLKQGVQFFEAEMEKHSKKAKQQGQVQGQDFGAVVATCVFDGRQICSNHVHPSPDAVQAHLQSNDHGKMLIVGLDTEGRCGQIDKHAPWVQIAMGNEVYVMRMAKVLEDKPLMKLLLHERTYIIVHGEERNRMGDQFALKDAMVNLQQVLGEMEFEGSKFSPDLQEKLKVIKGTKTPALGWVVGVLCNKGRLTKGLLVGEKGYRESNFYDQFDDGDESLKDTHVLYAAQDAAATLWSMAQLAIGNVLPEKYEHLREPLRVAMAVSMFTEGKIFI